MSQVVGFGHKNCYRNKLGVYGSIFKIMSTLALELKNAFLGSQSFGNSVLTRKICSDLPLRVNMSILTKISTSFPDPVIVRSGSFDIRNSVMSMKTCQDRSFRV